MSIKVTCSNCSSNFNLNDSLEGKKVRCSKCKNIIEVIKKDEPETEELNDNKEENISSEFNLEDTSLKAQDEIENKEELELNIEKQEVVNKEEEEKQKVQDEVENKQEEKIELDKLDKNNLTESFNEDLIDNPSDNDDFLEKSMDIGEEPKKSTLINKKLIIIFIIMLLLGAGILYAYKTGLFNSLGLLNKNESLNSAKEIKKEALNKKTSDVNYMLDFSGSIEFNGNLYTDSIYMKSGSLNISGLKVYSNNKGLNQRVSLGDFSLNIDNNTYSGSNLNIVSDNEKVYLFLEKGFDQIVKTLGQNYSTGTIDLFKSSFGTGKYVKIDNSKPLLTAFGELSKNKLLKDVIIGLSTSNPKEYFSKNGIDTKLQKYFKSDKVLKYLFKEGEKDVNSGKIPLTLNSSICSDYAPVVLSILDQVKGNPLLNLSNNFSNGNLIEECNKSLTQANKFLPMFMQMYKEGDTTLGNFKLYISSGNMLDINMTYKNHILTTGYLSMQTPDKSIDFKAKLDNTSKVSSTLKLNYNKDGIILTGSVIDGSGTIDIIGKQQGLFDVSGKITIKDYLLTSYNIDGKLGIRGSGRNYDIIANGNLSKGKIHFGSKASKEDFIGTPTKEQLNKYITKVDFDYNRMNFNLNYINNNYYYGNTNIKLSYNGGELDGEFNIGDVKRIIKGHYNNLKDFNLNIKNTADELNLNTSIKGLNEIEYILFLTRNGVKLYDGKLSIKKSSKNGLDIYDIIGFYNSKMISYNYDSSTGKMNTGELMNDISSNFSATIKMGGVEYSIPKNYDEVDVKMNERLILPDYTSAGRTKIDRKTLLIGGTTGLAIGGTVAYISLQGYSADARNSKRTQDLNNLAGSINIKSTMGIPLQSLVIRADKYEGKNMYVGGVKLVGGINYFAGTPNYVALGVRPEDFKDPNGEEYKIGVTTLKGGVFEILGYTENGDGTQTAKLNGTYNANDTLILKAGKDYEIIGDNVIKIIPTYINRIQRNDIIGGNKVLNISPDGSEITFEQKFDKKIMFLIPDIKGLISVDGSVVKDGDRK